MSNREKVQMSVCDISPTEKSMVGYSVWGEDAWSLYFVGLRLCPKQTRTPTMGKKSDSNSRT